MFAINLNHLLAAKDISNAVFSFYQDSLELWAILVVRQTHKNSPRFSSESQIWASELKISRKLIGRLLSIQCLHWLITLAPLIKVYKNSTIIRQETRIGIHIECPLTMKVNI